MANFLEQKNRNVLPNFRTFDETIGLGELDGAEKTPASVFPKEISRDLIDWEADKSVAVAADLLSCAAVAGLTSMDQVRKAARYILDSAELATASQTDLAKRILVGKVGNTTEPPLPRISDFLAKNTQEFLRKRIHSLKHGVRRFEFSPLVYVELARLYSILGQEEHAKRNMLIAHHLAPNNRYVLRSFVRLFSHYDQFEFAYHMLNRSPLIAKDPWLLSAKLALATIMEKSPKDFKLGMELVRSNQFSPKSLTELQSALGTVELLNGSKRKSRDLFESSLIAPNDNSLAQAEWALSKDRLFDLDIEEVGVKRNYEALAREAFNIKEWDNVVRHAESWFMDMPFAMRPIVFGCHVSSVILDDQDTAEMFCRAGLVSHPGDPLLKNNLAYALALNNKPDEALLLIEGISIADVEQPSTRVCLTATKGLVHFRKGNYPLGRKLYLEAVETAKSIEPSFVQLAILNYAREEALCGSPDMEPLINKIRKLKIDPKLDSLKILRDRVLDIYAKSRKG